MIDDQLEIGGLERWPTIRVDTWCARCGALLDRMDDVWIGPRNEAPDSTRTLSAAALWGYVAQKQHDSACVQSQAGGCGGHVLDHAENLRAPDA